MKNLVSTINYSCRYILLRINSFWIHLLFFLSLSCIGYWILNMLNTRTHEPFTPRNIDFFYMCVSAATVSSMSTVEMEVFSNSQLIVLTVLMFIGGEVFSSMLELHLRRRKLTQSFNVTKNNLTHTNSLLPLDNHHIKLGHVKHIKAIASDRSDFEKAEPPSIEDENLQNLKLRFNDCIKLLGFVVLGYLLVAHLFGVSVILIYLRLSTSAKNVLHEKGLKQFTFSLFTTVSTFASCGFVPTNENMIVFSKNSGLLLILIPQVLMGNTLFPSCLRFAIWITGKFFKKEEAKFLLENSNEVGYLHLLPALHSSLLAATVFGLVIVQLILFCLMEWTSAALSGLDSYQKVVGSLFMAVNARHTGETIVDISTIAPAILVVFVVMMYLPPHTSFLPVKGDDQHKQAKGEKKITRRGGGRGKLWENMILSQLAYLSVFIVLICITERKKMKEDPLNFNVLNIVIEVISAYGNVGFTTGYSCERRLKADGKCVNKWHGFSGKWSDPGKLILIVVMFFGRLKQFNMDGGIAWKLM